MNTGNSVSGKFGFDEQEWWTLLFVGVFGLSMGVFGVHEKIDAAREWVLEHDIVVPADGATVTLPGRIGIDTPRLAIVAGVVLLVVAGLWRRHQMRRRGSGDSSRAGSGSEPGARRGDPS
jgi:hypothetical protein